MHCSEYLALFSDFRDGRTEEAQSREIEEHLRVCPRCEEHFSAVERGVSLLRSVPEVDLPPDFHPRLRHRLFHLHDSARIATESLGSGATTLAVLAVAAVLAIAAWAPRAGAGPATVELAPLVVAAPATDSFTPAPRASTFFRDPSFITRVDFQDGPWGDTHQLLFEYSSLSERRRSTPLTRIGIQ